MALSSPGVYVSEGPLKARVNNINLSSSVAAFFGTSGRGPVTPTLVQSWTEYTANFGSISTDYDLGYALYHYFANGGTSAYVTRVVGTGASVSTTSSNVKYYTSSALAASAVGTLCTVTATNPGVWGNSLSVVLSDGLVAASATVIPTFNLTVYLNSVEVERWTELSALPSSSRYITSIINNYSKYIDVSNVITPVVNTFWGVKAGSNALASGADGAAPLAAGWVSSFDLLDTVSGVLMINAVGQSDTTIVAAVLAKASARGNSIALIDPATGNTDAAAFISEVTSHRSSAGANYGIYCAPMLTMIDPARSGPAALRRTFPSGPIAGLYARTEAERTVGKTPAGYGADIRNALGVDIKFKESEIGTLYDAGINCLKQLPGSAVVLFGGRTLERLNPDRYVSVRRSLNYLKQSLSDATQFAIFEPNDSRLRSAVSAACGNVLSSFWSAGGLKGTSPQQAYYVVCDESNNTGVSVDNGEVRVEIGVALQQPAEFIVIQLSQWTGGSNAVETL